MHKDSHGSFIPDRKYNTAPEVVDYFVDDDEKEILVLANGNTILKDKYDSIWNPTRSKVITDKLYKGKNPDGTKIS